MAKINKDPRLSVNKLGEYITSKAGRQNRILRDQKFPSEFITTYYRDALDTISLFLSKNMEDINILERKTESLDQQPAEKVYEYRRISNNIDAIETFMDMLDDIDFKGGSPRLGQHAPPTMKIRNVAISVRPEVVLTGTGKSKTAFVGGIKLHFPKTFPLPEDAAGYISAAMQMYCSHHLSNDGVPYAPYCQVIDIASGTVWPGVQSIKQRTRDIENACQQIAALWPTIRQ